MLCLSNQQINHWFVYVSYYIEDRKDLNKKSEEYNKFLEKLTPEDRLACEKLTSSIEGFISIFPFLKRISD